MDDSDHKADELFKKLVALKGRGWIKDKLRTELDKRLFDGSDRKFGTG